MGIVLLSIFGSIIAGLILFFILPFFKNPRDKFTAWIQKKFRLLKQKESTAVFKRNEDLKLLEEIISPLLFINQLPSFPDTKKEDIRDKLFEIHTKARKIRTNDFDDIKLKLIQYSEKVEKIHVNISLTELLKLLVRNNGVFKLVEEIREIINIDIKRREEK